MFSWVGKLIAEFLKVGGIGAGFLVLFVFVVVGLFGLMIREFYSYKKSRGKAIDQERSERNGFFERMISRSETSERENLVAINEITKTLAVIQIQTSSEIVHAEDRHRLHMAEFSRIHEKQEKINEDIWETRGGSA